MLVTYCWIIEYLLSFTISVDGLLVNYILVHFHLKKCKILQIHNNESLCTKILPLAKYHHFINEDFIDFTECQRDLGVLVNSNFKWDDHQL